MEASDMLRKTCENNMLGNSFWEFPLKAPAFSKVN